jgi:hypothetical protein
MGSPTWFKRCGFAEALPELLANAVYVGVSVDFAVRPHLGLATSRA